MIITGASKEVLINEIKPQLALFLQKRGLTLSEEKTHVTHINDGFDFLGFNLRKYNGKLLIKPSKSNVLLFLRGLRELIRKYATIKVNDLIKIMNPKLRGWANYYRHVVAKQVFSYVDYQVFLALWKWCVRRHPNKGKKWIARKYFVDRNGHWQFHGGQKIADMDCVLNLVKIAYIPIKRHVKIRSATTPYNPEYEAYLSKRKLGKGSGNTWFNSVLTAL